MATSRSKSSTDVHAPRQQLIVTKIGSIITPQWLVNCTKLEINHCCSSKNFPAQPEPVCDANSLLKYCINDFRETKMQLLTDSSSPRAKI